MHWNSWWHSGGMWLFWFAVFAIVGVAIYFGLRALKKTERPHDSPREILEKRLARGEIDRDEYQEAIKDLRQF